MENSSNSRLKLKDKCVYGMAGIGDGMTYAFLATFLMFFLTSIAGIGPAAAGFIVAIGTVCDVLAGPFAGYFSDNCTSRFGKRRPFIFLGAIPLAITTALLFTYVDLSPGFKVAYYCIIVIMFWASFSCFFVPYTALGSEMTTDYDERLVLRSFTGVCNNIGNIIGVVIPSFLVGILMDAGQSRHAAWSITGIGIGLLAGAAVIITALGTGERDRPAPKSEKKEKFSFIQMMKEYLEILKLKPLLILVATSIMALTGLTLTSADRMYFLTYKCGFSSNEISIVMLVGCVAGFLSPLVVNFITKFMDKKKAYIVIMIAFSIIMMACRWWDVTTMWQMIIVSILFGAGYMSYWLLMPTLIYDICEYDNYMNGKQRSGQIMSLQGIAEGVAEALGSQILGIVLQICGFASGASEQTPAAESAIENCMFILPFVLVLISCILMWKYPITKEKFNEIQEAIRKKENNAGTK